MSRPALSKMVLCLGLTLMSFKASAAHTVLRNNSLGMRKVQLTGCGGWDMLSHIWKKLKEEPERYSIWYTFFPFSWAALSDIYNALTSILPIKQNIELFFLVKNSNGASEERLWKTTNCWPDEQILCEWFVEMKMNPSFLSILPMYRNSNLIQRLFFFAYTHSKPHDIGKIIWFWTKYQVASVNNRKLDLEYIFFSQIAVYVST